MNSLWFLSIPGDLHEDHIPYGIFTSLDKIQQAIENYHGTIDIIERDLKTAEYTIFADEDGDVIDVTYYAYLVPLDTFNPGILRT